MKINGAELQKLRLSKGFSQSQLAKKCNISLSALRKYEHGERNPKPVVIDRIIHELGVHGYRVIGITNADRIRAMGNWELAEFIYNVSNNLVKISTCEEDCELCESSEDYCIYQIGEWLINESNK